MKHGYFLAAFARVPSELNEVVMMMTLLLPGTVIIYYGDEIGMQAEGALLCEDTLDPYVKPPYMTCNDGDTPEVSRDPARTPMQVRGQCIVGGGL